MDCALLRRLNPFTRLVPGFSARLSAGTTITAGNWVKATFGTEEYDNLADYDAVTNFRFQPTVYGVYFATVLLAIPINANKTFAVAVYKNGTVYKQNAVLSSDFGTSEPACQVACQVILNGSTDYIEAFAFNGDSSSQNLVGSTEKNHFSAFRIMGVQDT